MKLKPYANIVEEATTGLRMPEALARQIADAAKGLPKDFTYRRVAKAASEFQLEEGSRSDVSTVTTDAIDHQKEVVLPTGLDFAVFRSNPVVPFAHSYDVLPVGRCMWIKASGNGVAAMTKYAKCPPNHTDWLPDAILSLMQEGMCTGKSIGFIPTHMRAPTGEEVARRPELKGAQVIIDKSTLLEYSVAPVPCNPEALTVAVSKSLGNTAAAATLIAAAKAFAPELAEDVEFDPAAILKAIPSDAEIEELRKSGHGAEFGSCGHRIRGCRCEHSGDPRLRTNVNELCAECSKGKASPEPLAAFISPETLAAYQRRLIDQLPARVEAAARAKFADALDRLRGRV